MKSQEAKFIIDCLSKDRTIFHYYRDRYAIELLRYYVGKGKPVREVRQSPFARLLQKPLLKNNLADMADGQIVPEKLEIDWPIDSVSYTLTLDTWGSKSAKRWSRYWHQTSRPGVNLVLQVNFPESHNRMYRKLIKPAEDHPFECDSHPIHKYGKHTLGWVRMDIDLNSGVALIEEIQNDWIRSAIRRRKLYNIYHRQGKKARIDRIMRGSRCGLEQINRYVDMVLKPYIDAWDEAILCAAIRFIRCELGIRNIFYHTFESGKRIKHICGSPPRSMYTTLPKKFCFTETDLYPEFLHNQLHRKRQTKNHKACRFFVLEL